MRCIDWSSDVCSSDLADALQAQQPAADSGGLDEKGLHLVSLQAARAVSAFWHQLSLFAQAAAPQGGDLPVPSVRPVLSFRKDTRRECPSARAEIGRAS